MLGKYRICRRIGSGAFATVYEAHDTIEGLRVALKVPHRHSFDDEAMELICREVRLIARLDHENILPLRNAMFVDDHFVIASPLGERTLTDRLRSRMGTKTAMGYAAQLIEALAYAHQKLSLIHI